MYTCKGIGLVNLVLVGKNASCIPVGYRILSKKIDGKTKHDHFQEMVYLALIWLICVSRINIYLKGRVLQ